MRFRLVRFLRSREGNVAIMAALAAIPIFGVAGMGIDYGLAASKRAQLDAFADAAVLSAVTPTMMAQSTTLATTTAQNTFNAQAGSLSGVSYSPTNVSVNVSTAGSKRTVTLNYSANYPPVFAGLLGISNIPITGSASSTAGFAPNIDFYLLLDDSPSMAIAATQAGINTMVANTSSQGGCAFGCHETHPSTDNLGNPGGEDNYTLARNLGVTLRIDLLRQAVQDLMSTASSAETKNNASYRMSINTFDTGLNSLQALTSSLSTAGTSAGNISLLTVYDNNWLTSRNQNQDTDTNFDTAMNGINSLMPNPGSGTTTAGDKPQEVLFLVSDGVEDEMVGGSRQQSMMNLNLCNAIKARGIRIAVLYTTYLPLPTNAWYNQYIAPFQGNIASNMESCASPGLYYQVSTDGDISAALASLFQLAIQSAYLSH